LFLPPFFPPRNLFCARPFVGFLTPTPPPPTLGSGPLLFQTPPPHFTVELGPVGLSFPSSSFFFFFFWGLSGIFFSPPPSPPPPHYLVRDGHPPSLVLWSFFSTRSSLLSFSPMFRCKTKNTLLPFGRLGCFPPLFLILPKKQPPRKSVFFFFPVHLVVFSGVGWFVFFPPPDTLGASFGVIFPGVGSFCLGFIFWKKTGFFGGPSRTLWYKDRHQLARCFCFSRICASPSLGENHLACLAIITFHAFFF